MRESLRMLIDLEPDLEVCGEASQAVDALDKIPRSGSNLVLVDLTLPDMSGLDFVRELTARHPNIATLVVSGHTASRFADAAIEAGARGFVQKGLPSQLHDAIRAVLRGETYTSGS
jgi:DNA-binding NarL/FixJ family response regulator